MLATPGRVDRIPIPLATAFRISPVDFTNTPPVLCLVTNRSAARGDLAASVYAAVKAGVDWVQVRERDLDDTALLAHAEALAEAAQRGAADRDGQVRILINRRSDVALAIGADGVQLGFDAVAAERARELLGKYALIGVSTHSVDEATCVAAAASYTQLAPLFAPLSKSTTRPPLGLEALKRATANAPPVIAQGGITPENAAAAIAAGASGIAITGSILQSPDPSYTTELFRRALDRAATG
jgi:thiamine-phosphate pyrophosphorylase